MTSGPTVSSPPTTAMVAADLARAAAVAGELARNLQRSAEAGRTDWHAAVEPLEVALPVLEELRAGLRAAVALPPPPSPVTYDGQRVYSEHDPDVVHRSAAAAVAGAVCDHAQVVGTVIYTDHLDTYDEHDNAVTVHLDPPAQVTVLPARPGDLGRWTDDRHCDPLWTVDLRGPHPRPRAPRGPVDDGRGEDPPRA